MPNRCAHVPPYVAVEGVKGAGKSTALGVVRRALRNAGVRVASLDPTARGCPLHPLELLHGSIASGADGLTERLYAYRSNRQTRLHLARCETSDVVLGDRSFLTTLATRWRRSKTIGERAHFDRCRALEWAIPIPDHVIYIDAPISEIRRRVELRRRRYGVRDECVKRLQDAQNAYAAIRQSSLPELAAITWHLVSNDGLPERVAVAVLRIVLTILIHEKSRNEATALS